MSALLAGTGVATGYHSVEVLQDMLASDTVVQLPGALALSAALVSIVVKEILYRMTISVADREHSAGKGRTKVFSF